MREIVEMDVCGELGRKGRRLKEAYARLAGECGVKCCIEGMDARPYLKFEDQGGVSERELRWLFIQEMAKSNVLMVGNDQPVQ